MNKARKHGEGDSRGNNDFFGLDLLIVALLIVTLFYLLSRLIKQNIDITIINMSRINKNIKFKIKKNSKIEISFRYKVKNSSQKSLNLCYSVANIETATTAAEALEINGQILESQGKALEMQGEALEIKGEALAYLFQKSILERFLLRIQTKNTVYSTINLWVQNELTEQNYKHYLIPKRPGTAT